MFGRRRTPSARPSLLFRISRPIAPVVHLLCFTGPLVVALSFWWRDRNRMNSYRVSTVDVPKSPVASGARGPWQLGCDSRDCHEERWVSVLPSVVVFLLCPSTDSSFLDSGPANLFSYSLSVPAVFFLLPLFLAQLHLFYFVCPILHAPYPHLKFFHSFLLIPL